MQVYSKERGNTRGQSSDIRGHILGKFAQASLAAILHSVSLQDCSRKVHVCLIQQGILLLLANLQEQFPPQGQAEGDHQSRNRPLGVYHDWARWY